MKRVLLQRSLFILCLAGGTTATAQVPETARPAPIQGWVPTYDAHIRAETAKAPAMLALPANRMSDFFPRWEAMPADARLQFYADLLSPSPAPSPAGTAASCSTRRASSTGPHAGSSSAR